ncbi:unnamed protein product [Adineta steineri]|uniref:G-protein coupled receptors family 1 profile domain-containing protein n=1 Tax=Adineta steineri TaxID=433720 RepID=A0A819N3U3_9BILA|nr:unnamed protein product [Adineta steineri]CAF1428430.1 unnamed protein product [Adineta steineri]CAF3989040.1 unnamed protein product [Adineta steineri]CAF4036864.1 unnamed protein product [Adineta steineri]
MSFILTCCEPSCLILASIDRVLVTSPNAGTRRRSTRRLTIINIIIVCSFWAVFHIHTLIFIQIVQYGTNYFVCIYQPGEYTTFISYYSLVITGCLPPTLMAIFGFWAVKNIRQIRRVRHNASARTTATVVVVGGAHTLQSKDQQLIRMLFIEILSYIICKYPGTIMLIYQQITQYDIKSDERQQIEQAIQELTAFLYFVENSIGCYTNMIASKTFRTELKRMLIKIPTGYVIVKVLPTDTVQNTARICMEEVVLTHEFSGKLITDQGLHFKNELPQAIAILVGYERVFFTSYHPQTNNGQRNSIFIIQ